MRARRIDYSLRLFVWIEVVCGYGSFLIGRPEDRWCFGLHGVVRVAITVLLGWKLRRVWRSQYTFSWIAGDLPALATITRAVTLDCTGGWYTTHR